MIPSVSFRYIFAKILILWQSDAESKKKANLFSWLCVDMDGQTYVLASAGANVRLFHSFEPSKSTSVRDS